MLKQADDKHSEIVGKNILIVDDLEDNQMLLECYLLNTPHIVTIVENGLEAVEIFEIGRFDVIFMDIQMPVMDGLTATRKIRDIEKEKNSTIRTPIIALTAHSLEENIKQSMDAGCDYHQNKPIRKSKLFDLILKFAL